MGQLAARALVRCPSRFSIPSSRPVAAASRAWLGQLGGAQLTQVGATQILLVGRHCGGVVLCCYSDVTVCVVGTQLATDANSDEVSRIQTPTGWAPQFLQMAARLHPGRLGRRAAHACGTRVYSHPCECALEYGWIFPNGNLRSPLPLAHSPTQQHTRAGIAARRSCQRPVQPVCHFSTCHSRSSTRQGAAVPAGQPPNPSPRLGPNAGLGSQRRVRSRLPSARAISVLPTVMIA